MKEYQHEEKKKYFFFNLNTTANETCEYFAWRTNFKKKKKKHRQAMYQNIVK